MNAAEINSSFYRPHRRSTYERWAASVPADFGFSAKIPKTISHEKACVDCRDEFERFLNESAGLAEKRQLLLLQLPPKFAFDRSRMTPFFDLASELDAPPIVCEPRHPSWFTAEADEFLAKRKIARVAADPARVPAAAVPGGWSGLAYFRMHGSPRTYYSSYSDAALGELARAISAASRTVWCIFDNTASGVALGDALRLEAMLRLG